MTNKNSKLDLAKACLVIAPHLEYPTRNGGDLLIDRRWAEFSRYVPFVDIVGKCTVTRYSCGKLVSQCAFENEWRSKRSAAARTVLRRSHYLLEKYLGRAFRAKSLELMNDPSYGTVVFSLISTATLYDELPVKASGRLYCIETQNDEIKWFRDLGREARNPVAKFAASLSERWIISFLRRHENTFLYIHVSEADFRGYLELSPGQRGIVAPVGVDMEKNTITRIGSSDKVRLIFAGSLGVKMNYDALNVFAREFFPALKSGLGEGLEVRVVGSRPGGEVKALCGQFGWELFPDVTDEKLVELYASSTFSILPFHYVTGGKLKLLKSLSLGVPFLSTLEMREQINELMHPCLLSNDPDEWLARILEVKKNSISKETRAALIDYAMRFSWDNIVSDMVGVMSCMPSAAATKKAMEAAGD